LSIYTDSIYVRNGNCTHFIGYDDRLLPNNNNFFQYYIDLYGYIGSNELSECAYYGELLVPGFSNRPDRE